VLFQQCEEGKAVSTGRGSSRLTCLGLTMTHCQYKHNIVVLCHLDAEGCLAVTAGYGLRKGAGGRGMEGEGGGGEGVAACPTVTHLHRPGGSHQSPS
jgi:hypothetical protein